MKKLICPLLILISFQSQNLAQSSSGILLNGIFTNSSSNSSAGVSISYFRSITERLNVVLSTEYHYYFHNKDFEPTPFFRTLMKSLTI